ncbi:uncharacterized protein LOC122237114 [Panthera tigris]|uniref:uncharacterized protein LOC122237114 n=1 Tax=Panthera tigris TaxID=9694 RepID=UPI001C6FA368|nr:uncharacterized protein LOC122237114 [Panthera tigris]
MAAPRSAVPASFFPVTEPASCLVPFRTNLSWRRPVSPSGPACIGSACAATAGSQSDSVVVPLSTSGLRGRCRNAPEVRRGRYCASSYPLGFGGEWLLQSISVAPLVARLGTVAAGCWALGVCCIAPRCHHLFCASAPCPLGVLVRARARSGGKRGRKSGTSRPGRPTGCTWVTQTRPPPSRPGSYDSVSMSSAVSSSTFFFFQSPKP